MSIYSQRTMPWSAEEDRKLTILWEAGWSTLSIGAALGRGKNAVCGRARRLDLDLRGSPIPVKLCAERIAQFKRQVEAGNDAAREAIARAA